MNAAGETAPVVEGRRGPLRGPCRTCGAMFRSTAQRVFCSLACHNSNPESRARLQRYNEELKKSRIKIACANCGRDLERKPSQLSSTRRAFCDTRCYRSWMAERFDRAIANPESIALPQGYDEFLDRDELPCVIAGCDWVGASLGNHLNFTHGLSARAAKMAAGFNLRTGLVGRSTSAKMSAAKAEKPPTGLVPNRKRLERKGDSSGYVSLEGQEHRRKNILLVAPDVAASRAQMSREMWADPVKRAELLARLAHRRKPAATFFACASCGAAVETQWRKRSGLCGPCLHASVLHRNATEPWKEVLCSKCGRAFMATRNVARQARKGTLRPTCVECKNAKHPLIEGGA